MKSLGRELINKNITDKNSLLNAYLYTSSLSDNPDKSGSLSGTVMGVKDNINIAGMPMTCGSKMLEGYISPYTATVAQRLMDAGAAVAGKLNMDEFAMGSSNTYSAYGDVKNPWDNNRVSGGSSGGSAAAVAAGMCDFALGSDTGGSVRQPAAYCGVYGFKPTYGVLSRYGLTAFASSLDQIGVLSRSAGDIKDIMRVASGRDSQDSTSIDAPEFSATEMTLAGKRIGVIKEYAGSMKPHIRKIYDDLILFIKNNGGEIVELSFPEYDKVVSVYQIIATAEASSNLARFDGVRYTPRSEGADLMEVYLNTRSQLFGPEVRRRIALGTFVLSRKCYDSYYLKAAKVRTLIYNAWHAYFDKADFVLTPTTADIAFKRAEQPDAISLYLEDLFTIPANLTGMPAISFPAGVSNAMPVGFQLCADRLKDSELLSMASLIENKFYNFSMLEKEIEKGRRNSNDNL